MAVNPIPVPGFTGTPTDPDFDGLYEDLNANERIDFNDVVVFFRNMEWIAQNEPAVCFDLNGNERIDFNDIVTLFKEIGTPLPWEGLTIYDEAANGSTVQIPIDGGGLAIKLAENPTTGHHWNVTVTSGISIVDDWYISNAQKQGTPGAGGTHVWILSGILEGSQTFSAIYMRPWENVTGNEETYILNILVGEAAPCISLPSGTSLLEESMRGSRFLIIDNQNEYDAVVSLRIETIPYAAGNKVMSFYIRAHDQYTDETIKTGNYTLWYKLGECWDTVNSTFRVDKGAWRFDDSLDYDDDTAGYKAWIYAIDEGNATTTQVPSDLV
ncbi:MAG: protease inhibitor I42 family protein [Methanoregulaceae archaeon]|jgi:inhibitor of cysteine peptidase|nr:protease inhibitor I42 family protein [Methanoregulaceae archaeon]